MKISFMSQMLKCMASLAVLSGLTACVGMPTEKHSVSDMRPGISFKTESAAQQQARVLIDGLDVGAVRDYLEGDALVRVTPGTHLIRVVSGGQVALDEKVYLGDGVSRSFILK
jgi:hypothetical protein